MYYLADAHQTRTAKLLKFFEKFQTKVHALRDNETNITTKNVFPRDYFAAEGNHE